MATLTHQAAGTVAERGRQTYRAVRGLQIGFVAAPIVAGLDKFTNVLTDWTQYLWPAVPELLGVSPLTFMGVVGAVEVAAGVLVAIRPRIGGLVVAGWLGGIILNLLLMGAYYDIALRDVGLALAALALAELAPELSDPPRS